MEDAVELLASSTLHDGNWGKGSEKDVFGFFS